MRVSMHWARQLLDFDLPTNDELVAVIGAQLGGVEEVIDNKPKYERVRVAKVVNCQPVPDSDHLNVCLIDDGNAEPDVARNDDGFVQVVCGAANVREGLLVAWLPPGSTVPSTYGSSDPFVLSVRPLRGVDSNGMLASAKELALGDDHDGILELDDTAEPGSSFADQYGLNDIIIDIENKMFTHRPDCFGQLGIARELAGIFGHDFDESKGYSNLELAMPETESSSQQPEVNIVNEIPGLAPRFTAQVFNAIAVRPSSVALQAALTCVGIRPINNIVDITNFIMAFTGQPTHAYDYDKVLQLSETDGNATERPTIIIRQPHDGEQVTLLNGKTVTPRREAILIATPQAPIGLAGVMGGASTEVSVETTKIIFEVASFDMYSVRKTSMAHGLFSEAVTRFSKGQSPLQTLPVLQLAAKMLLENGAHSVGQASDDNHVAEQSLSRKSISPAITISEQFINDRLGTDLNALIISEMLQRVGFNVDITNDSIQVLAPFWRTDIELREDIVEEVGRLYGYDKLPMVLPSRTLLPASQNGLLPLKMQLRTIMSNAGANELLTYSFVHGKLLEKVGQNAAQAYKISNALSPDLQYVRLSLTPSLLDKVSLNIRAGYDAFGLFEIGRSHVYSDDSHPQAKDVLAFVYAASPKSKIARAGAPYYQALNYLRQVIKSIPSTYTITYHALTSEESITQDPVTAPFEQSRSAFIYAGDIKLGIIGEYRQQVHKLLKLTPYSAGFEIDLQALHSLPAATSVYKQISKFPRVTQDVTLKVSKEHAFEAVNNSVMRGLNHHADDSLTTVAEPLMIYAAEPDPDSRSYSFRITVSSSTQTLTEQMVTAIVDQIAALAGQELGAERV